MSEIKTISLTQLNERIKEQEDPVQKKALLIIKSDLKTMKNSDSFTKQEFGRIVAIRKKAEEEAAEQAIEFDLEDLMDSLSNRAIAIGDTLHICFPEND